jgi:hypothetical protein
MGNEHSQSLREDKGAERNFTISAPLLLEIKGAI